METCLFRMQDGRSFTDYRPRCTINSSKRAAINSFDQRMNMIHNAEKMMQDNLDMAKNGSNCMGKCIQPSITPAEMDMVQCGKNFCDYKHGVNPNGVGTGRNYNVQ